MPYPAGTQVVAVVGRRPLSNPYHIDRRRGQLEEQNVAICVAFDRLLRATLACDEYEFVSEQRMVGFGRYEGVLGYIQLDWSSTAARQEMRRIQRLARHAPVRLDCVCTPGDGCHTASIIEGLRRVEW